jgi:plastin-3
MDGSVHTVLVEEEQVAFADWINDMFAKDTDVNHKLPLKKDGSDMYEKMDDGILLCKIINLAAPDTIDERAINKGKEVQIFRQHENLTLARNSASSVGVVVVGVDSHNIRSEQKKCWLVLGLVWQLIRMHLFRQININEVPGLVNLLKEGETLADLMKLGPEEILLRWVNYQLEKEGSSRRAKNLSGDIKDSDIYTDLIHQIAPKTAGVNKSAMQKSDLVERAGVMLEQADKIGCKQFVTPKDVKNGHEKLNLAFVANLFNTHPHLDPPAEDLDIIEETREEKTFRNWMNSLGVSPRVNYLYSDLSNGLILFQLMNFIKPGTCDMKKVVDKVKLDGLTSQKQHFEMLGNCDYAVECGKKLNLKLVGIGGSDLKEGHQMFTLAFVWQLMRAYTLSLLAKLSTDGKPVTEAQIIQWANKKLEEGGKSSQIRDFKDKSNRNAVPIIDIIDLMAPGTINYEFVKTGAGLSDEECFSNAKYAVNMARKIGAPVYALPEDISEVNDKMVMTVYASLMLADAIPA